MNHVTGVPVVRANERMGARAGHFYVLGFQTKGEATNFAVCFSNDFKPAKTTVLHMEDTWGAEIRRPREPSS